MYKRSRTHFNTPAHLTKENTLRTRESLRNYRVKINDDLNHHVTLKRFTNKYRRREIACNICVGLPISL